MPTTTNTHMPFLAKHGTETISLCCRKISGIWKLHRKINDQWVQLNTRRPVDAIECSPTAEYVNGQWRISFISGGAWATSYLKKLQSTIPKNTTTEMTV